MAKTQFHRNQKVWVESIGSWAAVERILPIWAKGFDEPVRITYDVGLGREFMGHELRAEQSEVGDVGAWRLMRARNKWQTPAECAHHPFPGTYPVIVTDIHDWGGWRTPGAEYDRDPMKVETQARLIAEAPGLLQIARELADFVSEDPDDAPEELQALAKRCLAVLRNIAELPIAANSSNEMDAEDEACPVESKRAGAA